MLAGLQGAANHQRRQSWRGGDESKTRSADVSTDVFSPCCDSASRDAGAQWRGFSAALGTSFPVTIAIRALTKPRLQAYDVLLPNGGRLHIDAEMRLEVQRTRSGRHSA